MTLLRLRPVLAALLVAAVSGCVSLRPLRTETGSPEVIIRSSRPPELIEGLREAMVRRGYRALLTNDRLAVFSRECEDFDTAFFYGAGWNATADFRVTFSLLDDALGTRVLTDIEIVTEAGTPEEGRKAAPHGHPEAHELQDLLETLQADLALRRHEEQWPDEPARPSQPPVWTGRS